VERLALIVHYSRRPRLATFAVRDAAGHNAHLERPDLTAALVKDWLARARSAATGAPPS
jgi:pimeloyl-ACP methyl ester carboxylesterase